MSSPTGLTSHYDAREQLTNAKKKKKNQRPSFNQLKLKYQTSFLKLIEQLQSYECVLITHTTYTFNYKYVS